MDEPLIAVVGCQGEDAVNPPAIQPNIQQYPTSDMHEPLIAVVGCQGEDAVNPPAIQPNNQQYPTRIHEVLRSHAYLDLLLYVHGPDIRGTELMMTDVPMPRHPGSVRGRLEANTKKFRSVTPLRADLLSLNDGSPQVEDHVRYSLVCKAWAVSDQPLFAAHPQLAYLVCHCSEVPHNPLVVAGVRSRQLVLLFPHENLAEMAGSCGQHHSCAR